MPLYEYDCRSCGKRSEILVPHPPPENRAPTIGELQPPPGRWRGEQSRGSLHRRLPRLAPRRAFSAPRPPPELRCPHCGSTRTEKVFSVFAAATGGGDEAPPVCGQGACPRCADD